MSLRRYIYHHSPLTSENQEDISLAMYVGGNDISPVDFHKRLFFKSVEDNLIYKEAFDAVIDFLTFDKNTINTEMDLKSTDWRRYVAICHFCVYLIDLYSIFGNTPEWEEFRLYFVATINEWNEMAGNRMRNKVYLYEVGDLNSANYIDTFPSSVLANNIPSRIFERGAKRCSIPNTMHSRSKLNYRWCGNDRLLIVGCVLFPVIEGMEGKVLQLALRGKRD